jgi:hypothetical protein
MKKYFRIITLFIALLTLAGVIGVVRGAFKLPIDHAEFDHINHRQPGSSQKVNAPVQTDYDDDIEFIHYSDEDKVLRLEFEGKIEKELYLDPNSSEIETFEILRRGKPVYLRFFSPAFYQAYGQKSQGVVILTRINPAELKVDPHNNVAADFPATEQLTTADLSFALIHSYLENHNKVDKKRPLCNAENANGLLLGVASSSCYIVCQGKSEVMTKFLASSTRMVHMWSRRKSLDGGYIFLWSELHTALEIFGNGKWYVGDPSYGFAYVKDATGLRLDTKEFIDYLTQQKSNELIFGLVHKGIIHEVPGEFVIKEKSGISGFYYTSDKRLEYKPVRDEPEFHE